MTQRTVTGTLNIGGSGVPRLVRTMTNKTQHLCEELKAINERRTNEDFSDQASSLGMAITHIEKTGDRWEAHNEEYGTFVNYCPFCGVRLEGDQ